MRRQLVTAAIVLIVSAALLPSASPAQTINACVSKNGSVRIVEPGTPCPRQDTPLLWNSGVRVYDADGVQIGPLSGNINVTFSVEGRNFSAPVGPGGWVQSQSSFYYFDSACTDGPYIIRLVTSDPDVSPPPPPEYFFTSLQLMGTRGYYQDGYYTKKILESGVVSVWRWDPLVGECLEYPGSGTYWFGSHASIELPAHPAPFTIR